VFDDPTTLNYLSGLKSSNFESSKQSFTVLGDGQGYILIEP